MKSYQNWKETHIHHEKLGGMFGMYGDDTHDAVARLVHRLIPIVEDALEGRTPTQAFDELMEALPVAFSMAIPEISDIPMIYGPSALRVMRQELEKLDQKQKQSNQPTSDTDLKPYRPSYDKERDIEFP